MDKLGWRPLLATRFLGVLIVGSVVWVPFGGRAVAEPLEEVVRAALESHPAASAARASHAAAEEETHVRRSDYYPDIRVNATAGRVYGDNATSRGLSTTRGAGYSWLGEGGVTLSQKLFDGAMRNHRVAESVSLHSAAAHDLVDLRETLALRAVQAYLDVMRAHDVSRSVEAHADRIRAVHARIVTMVREGALDSAAQTQAEDVLLTLKTIAAEQKARLETAYAGYAEIVGSPPEGTLAMSPFPDESLPQDPEEGVAFALDHHPALHAAEYRSTAQDHAHAAQKSALYPELGAELSYFRKELDDLIGGEVTDARGVVRMNWQFATGGAQKARIGKAEQDALAARARQAELARQVARNVRIAYAEMDSSVVRDRVLREREALGESLIETYRTQFEGGTISLLQLLHAENQLLATRMERIDGSYRLVASRYATLAALGELQRFFNVTPVSHVENSTDGGGLFPVFWGE